MHRIIIDTDPGQDIDDLLALHFALLRPELEILAITTVTWPSAGRARLVKRLLRHLGQGHIPVGAGMELPLRPMSADDLAQLHDVSRSMNHACFAEPHEAQDEVTEDAVTVMARVISASPDPVTLCCIAPLTNVACLLQRHPELKARIAGINLMGGEIALDRAEHNIAFDAVAADIVLQSGLPIRMGTWDVTRRFVFTADDMARYASGASPLHRDLARAMTAWHPAQSWKPAPVMYDLFPLVAAIAPACYTLTEKTVHVVTHGPLLGRTLTTSGVPMLVSTGIDVDAIRALFFATVFPAAGM